MKAKRKTIRQRPRGANAFEMLAANLKVADDAAWYAERLERLGVAMFGELWRADETSGESESLETAGCEHLDTSPGAYEQSVRRTSSDLRSPSPQGGEGIPDRGGEGNNS